MKRKHSNVGEKKEAKDMNDIVQYLQEKGTKIWPQFVALDLSKLPPITLDKTDYSVLLSKMQKLQTDVDMMRKSVETQYDISDSLKISNEKLQERVEQIEIKSTEEYACVKVSKEIKEKPVSDEDHPIGDRPFSCTKCDFKCDEIEVLNAHVESCQEIDIAFIPNNAVNADNRKQTGKVQIQMFDCPDCEFRFMTKDELDAHVDTHNNMLGGKIECHECNNTFNSDNEFALHLQLHQQQKLYTCPDCEYTDTVKDRLRIHMRNHYRDKAAKKSSPP